jgi:hypothetical protein
MNAFDDILAAAEQIAVNKWTGSQPFRQRAMIWREEILAVDGGLLTIANLECERYLTLEEKAGVVYLAVMSHTPPSVLPAPDRAEYLPHAFRALERSCLSFPDRGPDIRQLTGDLTRYMTLAVAKERLLPVTGAFAVYRGSSPTVLAGLLKTPAGTRHPEFIRHLRGRIRGSTDVNVFSTLAAWSESVPHEDLSARARDGLALPHLDGHEVIELRFRENTARGTSVFKKPTFADSLGRPVFWPSTEDDKYGFTRDLAVGLTARGGPEVWHGPFAATSITRVRALSAARIPMKPGCWTSHGRW